MNHITAVLIITFVCAHAQDDLGAVVFASVLFRHGDRSPISNYPNDPYDQREIWPQGSGQLTVIGREQHFNLGTFLRQRYADLLPEKYNADDIFVRSSDVDRTLMSAQCNLYGLYPHTVNFTTENVAFQPIPIHTTSSSNDMIYDASRLCPKYSKVHDLLIKSYSYECIMNITEDVRKSMAEKAGLDSYGSYIYDILFIENLYNLTLPEWTKEYFPEPMKSISLLEGFLSEAGTKELQRLYSGPLLKQMTENMQEKSKGTLNPDRKLFMYSGHDSTISNLLMNLGVFNEIIPPYASCVLVELRKKSEEYYVMVSYRNTTIHEPYILTIPECEQLCPLDTFINLTQSGVPEDFDAECQEDPDPDVEFSIPTFGLPEEWLQCFPKGVSNDGKYAYISR